MNYYKVLDLKPDASQEDIKKAYRKLSLQFHPDRNKNSEESVKNFQAINEAYETLGDSEKRKRYDVTQSIPFLNNENFNMFNPLDMNNLFSNLFNDLKDDGNPHIFFNAGMFPPQMPGFNNMGNPFLNPNFNPNTRVNLNMTSKPSAIVKTITINMRMVFTGGVVPLEVERWVLENNMKTQEKITYYVDIHQGVDDNEVIMLADKGNILSEKAKGDVKVFIKILNDSIFKRDGLDLILDKILTLKDALCGFSFDFKYLNDKSYTINNNEGDVIPAEYKKVITNMGLTRHGHTGNLIIHFHINFPAEYSKEQVAILKNVL